MSKTNTEKTIELKKVEEYYLIRRVGKRFKRCPALTGAKKVDFFENYLIADAIIYEIQEDEAGEVMLLKIEDTPIFDKQQSIEDYQERATGTSQQNVVACRHGDTFGQEVAVAKSLCTRGNDKITVMTPGGQISCPATIIYGRETSVGNNENMNIDDSNISKNCHVPSLYSSKRNSQNEKNKTAPGQSFPDKSSNDIPKEVEGFKTSDKDELEIGQTEDDYNSLEAGHTEETSMIETIFVKNVTGTYASKVRPGPVPSASANTGGGRGALQQMRPSTMNARSDTGQFTAQTRPGMSMPHSSLPGRLQQPQAPTMQQGARPRYSQFRNNRPQQQSQVIAAPREQRQILGDHLFPLIERMYPDIAGKITGMLLEIDKPELLHMLRSTESFKAKVEEAVAVLQAHQALEMTKLTSTRPMP